MNGSSLGLSRDILRLCQIVQYMYDIVTGAVASSKGVGVLQPLALALIVLTGIGWWFVPTAPKTEEGGQATVSQG